MDLGKFLKQRDIIYTLCAASISTQIVIIADLITSSIIMPLIDRNVNTGDNIENFYVQVNGAKMEIGKMLVALIRLGIVSIMLYSIYYLTY